jgi:hypothetical protein
MDTTTLLIIVVVVLLIGGGGFYGRGRWYYRLRPFAEGRLMQLNLLDSSFRVDAPSEPSGRSNALERFRG